MRRLSIIIIPILFQLVLAGCRNSREPISSTPSPYFVTANVEGQAEVDMDIRVPRKTISKRSRVVIQPELRDSMDSVVATLRPIVLDSRVYAKKLRRDEVLDHYVDPYAAERQTVKKRTRDLSIHYVDSIHLPAGIDNAQLIATLSNDGCGSCTGFGVIPLGTVVREVPPEPEKVELPLEWQKKEFVVKPKIREGRGEAHLQFTINLHDIDPTLADNRRELQSILDSLRPILSDTLATLTSLTICGTASADGPLSFNTPLSERRARAAAQWLAEELDMPQEIYDMIQITSYPEGWQPVLGAIRDAGDRDTTAVAQILEKYKYENDDVAERYIRKLPCWPRIRERYLQKDRKVIYTYTYRIRSFVTDEELQTMWILRPDAFNEEELLQVATLQPSAVEMIRVYEYTLLRYPDCQMAANNLAILYFETGQYTRAWDFSIRHNLLDATQLEEYLGSLPATEKGGDL